MKDSFTFSQYATHLRDFIRQCSSGGTWPISPASPGTEWTGPGVGILHGHADAEFNNLALALFSLQFRNLPLYRGLCQARHATPETLVSWDQIPSLSVSAFKEFEISSLPLGDRTSVFYSSGTTRQRPSRHFHSTESLQLYETSLQASFHRHMLGGGDDSDDVKQLRPDNKMEFVILTPLPTEVPHSSLAHMFETVGRAFGSGHSVFTGRLGAAGAWSLDIEATESAIDSAIRADRPIALLGTAFSFVELLDHFDAANTRYRLAEGSRVLETGGYKGRSRSMPKTELHGLIGKHLGLPQTHIVCEYGMCEISSQAYDQTISQRGERKATGGGDQPGRVFHFPPWVRVQVVSPETGRPVGEGEVGLIRVFDLANAWSVLAIETEDLGVRREAGFELLGRAASAEPRGCSLMAS